MAEIEILRAGGDGTFVVWSTWHEGFGRDVIAEEVSVDGFEDGGDKRGKKGGGSVDGGAGGGVE